MAVYNRKTGEQKHVGMVLHVRGTFFMDTSMDEVLIWNPDNKSTFTIRLCGDEWFAEKDASAEIIEAYYSMIRNLQEECDKENAESILKSVRVGATIKVVRGRLVKKGTISKVKSIYQGPGYTTIYLEDGSKTYSNNVLVEYRGEFIEPLVPVNRTFFFQAV